MLIVLPRIPSQFSVTDCKNARNGATARDVRRSSATTTYGIHAVTRFIRGPVSASLNSAEPVHSSGQLLLSSKSHLSWSFGIRKPALAAETTMRRPLKLPIRAGNSGPRNRAASTYGTVMANAANRANGQTWRPSAKDRLLPKKRVMKETKINGTSVPAIA